MMEMEKETQGIYRVHKCDILSMDWDYSIAADLDPTDLSVVAVQGMCLAEMQVFAVAYGSADLVIYDAKDNWTPVYVRFSF